MGSSSSKNPSGSHGSLDEGGSGGQLYVSLKMENFKIRGDLIPHVFGSVPIIGSWDPSRSLRMERESASTWELSFVVPPNHETLHFHFLLKPKDKDGPCMVEEGADRLLTGGNLEGDARAAVFRPPEFSDDAILEFKVFVKVDIVSPFDLAASWRVYKENLRPSTVRGIPDISINAFPEGGQESGSTTSLELDLESYVVPLPICASATVYAANLAETPRSEDYSREFPKYGVLSVSPTSSTTRVVTTNLTSSSKVNNISGFLPGRIVFFLVNTHLTPRPILLTRHGESQYNVRGRIGGDSVLSEPGNIYSKKLANFVEKRLKSERTASIWTSTLQRTIITATPIVGFPKIQWRALDEINVGVCDGMTYEEIKRNMPEEFQSRKKDKLRFRYPRGESYLDVIQRLEPVIIELERQRAPVVVISHQAVLRALYAYFADKPLEEIPYIEVPLHTIIEIQMGVTGVQEKRYKLMD